MNTQQAIHRATSRFIDRVKTWARAWNASQLEAAASLLPQRIDPLTGRPAQPRNIVGRC